MDSQIYGGAPTILFFVLLISVAGIPSALPENSLSRPTLPSSSSGSGSGQINSNSIIVALLDSHYTELVEKALLLQTLEDAMGRNNVTIFDPRNEALERDLDPEFKRFLLEPRNHKSLQTLILFHVIPTRIGSDSWPTSEAAQHRTLAADHLHLSGAGAAKKVDLATMVHPDVVVRPDDVTHGIERLLVPRSIQEDFNRCRSLASISVVLPMGAPEVDPCTHHLKKPAPPAPALTTVPIGEGSLPAFVHGTKNTTVLKATVRAWGNAWSQRRRRI